MILTASRPICPAAGWSLARSLDHLSRRFFLFSLPATESIWSGMVRLVRSFSTSSCSSDFTIHTKSPAARERYVRVRASDIEPAGMHSLEDYFSQIFTSFWNAGNSQVESFFFCPWSLAAELSASIKCITPAVNHTADDYSCRWKGIKCACTEKKGLQARRERVGELLARTDRGVEKTHRYGQRKKKKFALVNLPPRQTAKLLCSYYSIVVDCGRT